MDTVHAWKYRFSVAGLAPIIHHFFCVRKSSYAELLELESRIRQVTPPDHLKAPTDLMRSDRSWSSDPHKAMQQYIILAHIQLSQLILTSEHVKSDNAADIFYIHRSYFARAIREKPLDPLKHKYGHSVMVSYRGACQVIHGLRNLYDMYPKSTGEQQYFWSAMFAACVVLAALAIESPGSSLAWEAGQGMEQAVRFFETAPSKGSSSQSALVNYYYTLQQLF